MSTFTRRDWAAMEALRQARKEWNGVVRVVLHFLHDGGGHNEARWPNGQGSTVELWNADDLVPVGNDVEDASGRIRTAVLKAMGTDRVKDGRQLMSV